MSSRTLESLPEWALALLEEEPVGRLGLIDGTGHPRVLPITYALCDQAVWTVVDNKPKRQGSEPARLRWLRERPQAAITVDRYRDDWSALQWVQLIGEMSILDGPPTERVLEALSSRYPQYRVMPPPGPALRLDVGRAVWWRAG